MSFPRPRASGGVQRSLGKAMAVPNPASGRNGWNRLNCADLESDELAGSQFLGHPLHKRAPTLHSLRAVCCRSRPVHGRWAPRQVGHGSVSARGRIRSPVVRPRWGSRPGGSGSPNVSEKMKIFPMLPVHELPGRAPRSSKQLKNEAFSSVPPIGTGIAQTSPLGSGPGAGARHAPFAGN
jgi:hypothetical protein